MMLTTGMSPTTLRFVSSEEHFSVYMTRDGKEAYLAHGTRQRLVEFVELDVNVLWATFRAENPWSYSSSPSHQGEFLDLLRSMVIDPDEVDEFMFCNGCHYPTHEEELHGTGNGWQVCEDCLDDYYHCEGCEQYFNSTTTTLHDTEVCESCRDNYWTYCDYCDGYDRDANSIDHRHDNSDCCESPERSFTVRNDGEEPLENDTRVTVTLPAGHISDEGIGAISRLLRDQGVLPTVDEEEQQKWWSLSYRLTELGQEWQTKQGNYTKRLSRHAYKTFGLKVTPEMMSRVGNIASDHSTAIDFAIETTRNLNLPREDFAHDGSCWWTEYAESRCAFKTNGGFGLRTFSEENTYGSYVQGRAWVMPLKQVEHETFDGDPITSLTPTFETEHPDAFVVFNGYGDLSGYAPARIVSHMAGMTYRKIDFSCTPMYINSGSGYLVAREEIAEKYTDGELHLDVEQHSNLHDHEMRTMTYA